MATVIPASPINLTDKVSIKLGTKNYMYWRVQIGPLLRNNLLMGLSMVCSCVQPP
jgi:hypothetical protein